MYNKKGLLLRGAERYGGIPEAEAYSMIQTVKQPETQDYDYNEKNNHINLISDFDGEYITIRNNDEIIGKYRAQSGQDNYQYINATDISNKGPIPEGEWVLKYDDFETDTSPYDGTQDHWGRERVYISPVSGKRYDRTGFFLHGSYNGLGSAGCIDLGLQMPQFGGIMKKYKTDIPLTVKYNDKFIKK